MIYVDLFFFIGVLFGVMVICDLLKYWIWLMVVEKCFLLVVWLMKWVFSVRVSWLVLFWWLVLV